MHRLTTFVISILFLSVHCSAQTNSDDLSFFVQKIKSSYAGYPEKAKGTQFDTFVKKVMRENKGDTFRIMAKLANYFGDNHIQLFQMNAVENRKQDTIDAPVNLKKVHDYFSNGALKKEKYEGYWLNDYNNSVFAITGDKSKKGNYKVYLIETRSKVLPVGTLISELEGNASNKFFARYLVPGSGHSIYITPVFKSDSILLWGEYSKFRKLANYDDGNPILSASSSWKPRNSGKSLNDDTYLLTIPDFAVRLGSIDSIVKADSAKIYSAKNLILDLRGNRGGQVSEYRSITPLVYTRQIKNITASILCSDDLINAYKDGLSQALKSDPIDSATVKELQRIVGELEAGRGRFIPDNGMAFTKLDKVAPLPKNVGIITNYACQSAAEMMLLDFKQSDKVKTFGEPTFGAIDYLNAISLSTPSGKYLFTIATAKRNVATGEKPLDGKGIGPDVPISDAVPDWVQFVNNYYHEK